MFKALKYLRYVEVIVAVLAAVAAVDDAGTAPVHVRGLRVGKKTYGFRGEVYDEELTETDDDA